MTRSANARLVGAAFLLYIAAGVSAMVLSGRATRGETVAARLESVAAHPTEMGAVVVLVLVGSFCALVLAVSLYALTRDEDRDLAMLALACRVVEGAVGGVAVQGTLELMAVAGGTSAAIPDATVARIVASSLLVRTPPVGATFFAVGSTIFSWLLLRGRVVPARLAWLGAARRGAAAGARARAHWAAGAAHVGAGRRVRGRRRGVAARARRARPTTLGRRHGSANATSSASLPPPLAITTYCLPAAVRYVTGFA